MSTVHAAKGTEFDHVFIPSTGWDASRFATQENEEERRLYYVAMTRARQTVCLFHDYSAPNPLARVLEGGGALCRPAAVAEDTPPDVLQRRYELLGLDDIHLGFAGSRHAGHPTHQAIARLQPGSGLRMRMARERIDLIDDRGCPVARLSQAAYGRWKDRLAQIREVRVVALVRRERSDEKPDFRDRCRVDRWEVPLVEVVFSCC